MSILRQFTKTVSAQFQHLITQLENHEALAESAIVEIQDATLKAKGQLGRIRRDGASLASRLEQVRDNIPKWELRAAAVATADKEKALQCMKRKNVLEKEAKDLETQLVDHQRLESQLASDLVQLELRIAELKRKKNTFVARQTRAEVMQAQTFDYLGGMNEVSDIFDRWEARIVSYDYSGVTVDDLEQCFVEKEEQAELEKQLEALMARA